MVPRHKAAQRRPQLFIMKSYSAPVGGLNIRDPINMMPANDAVYLVNWIPQQLGVKARKGYIEWATNLVDEVKSVFSYQPERSDPAGFQLFGSTDNDIFDITISTTTPASVEALSGGADAGRFTNVHFANSAGRFLLLTAHAGGYKYYDGATWSTPTFGGGAGQVAGVQPANLCFVTEFKHRLWFIEKDTNNAWYAPTDALTGTFTKFDLGPFMTHGGSLSFIATWTIDAGEGIDDFLVFGGENGDIIIYKGTDPASITTFAKVGSWYIGRLPVGRRAFCKYGGDLLILSEMGLQPISYITRGGQNELRTSTTNFPDKIQPRLTELMGTLADSVGWELTTFSRENLLMIQKPTGGVSVFEQYAMYTNTNAWTLFNAMPMNCMAVANNEFYFGSTGGVVYKAFTGFFDNVLYGTSTGDYIQGFIQPAYSYMGYTGYNKIWSMVRPMFKSRLQPGVMVSMLVDFAQYSNPGLPTLPDDNSGSLWGVGVWNASLWGGQDRIFQSWYGVGAVGFVGSTILNTIALGDTTLMSIDYMFEIGGPL